MTHSESQSVTVKPTVTLHTYLPVLFHVKDSNLGFYLIFVPCGGLELISNSGLLVNNMADVTF